MIRTSKLEQVFASMVQDESRQGWVFAEASACYLECDIECPESSQTCGISVCLVVGIKDVD